MLYLLLVTLCACHSNPKEKSHPIEGTEPPTSAIETGSDTATSPHTTTTPPVDALHQLLNEAYRIDLLSINARFDLTELGGREPHVEGSATLLFQMLPNESKPVFHFSLNSQDPLPSITSITLDGEVLNKNTDVIKMVMDGANQNSFELQRELSPNEEHELVLSWQTDQQAWFSGWFASDVDDTEGRGNEVRWPTINAPHELADHHLTVVVHDADQYVAVGSGLVSSSETNDSQVFTFDSGRPIASYTMMFAVLPARQVTVSHFEADGVPVNITSMLNQNINDQLQEQMTDWMIEYQNEMGPFPMPEMQVLLIPWEDGMEYYGATTSGPTSMRHELAHMWWGCSGVGLTWGDTWIDEALAVWIEEDGVLPELPKDFSSDLGMSYGPLQTGFDTRAYGRGAQVMAEISRAMGGVPQMQAFLAQFHEDNAFKPFSTQQFIDAVVEEAPSLEADLQRWLFTP